jgi:hypothetical protein
LGESRALSFVAWGWVCTATLTRCVYRASAWDWAWYMSNTASVVEQHMQSLRALHKPATGAWRVDWWLDACNSR